MFFLNRSHIWPKLFAKRSKIVKFIYSEKTTKFCEIFTLLLSYVVPVKMRVKIPQNFVAFSEYMNFKSRNKEKLFLKLVVQRTLSP